MTFDELFRHWIARGFTSISEAFEGPLLIPLEPWVRPAGERRTLALAVPPEPPPLSAAEVDATTTAGTVVRVVQSAMGVRNPAPGVHVMPVVKTQRNAYAHVAIGRSSQNDIVIDQASVSRFHADIRWNEGVYSVRDAKSRNGTRRNGVRVVASHGEPIRPGDVLTFGEATCLFCTIEQQAFADLFSRLGASSTPRAAR
ncbi:MAG: FHA domain-containing protein [Deltaproteobacteria bacterium]